MSHAWSSSGSEYMWNLTVPGRLTPGRSLVGARVNRSAKRITGSKFGQESASAQVICTKGYVGAA
eukprot:scaffold29380_cov70-Phaeocystis_antarctica.AAC.2